MSLEVLNNVNHHYDINVYKQNNTPGCLVHCTLFVIILFNVVGVSYCSCYMYLKDFFLDLKIVCCWRNLFLDGLKLQFRFVLLELCYFVFVYQ